MKQTNINTAANVSRGIRPSPLIILFNFATRTEPTFLAFFLVPPGLEAFAFVGVAFFLPLSVLTIVASRSIWELVILFISLLSFSRSLHTLYNPPAARGRKQICILLDANLLREYELVVHTLSIITVSILLKLGTIYFNFSYWALVPVYSRNSKQLRGRSQFAKLNENYCS